MIVVSDATPLNYLTIVGHVDVLQQLFGTVLVPPSVAAELLHPKAPDVVRQFISKPPTWLQIRLPVEVFSDFAMLGAGEREAISLSIEAHADLLLTDDMKARVAAELHGVVVTGTLGLLRLAGRRQLIRVPTVIRMLQATNLRLPAAGVAELLAEFQFE